jgi:phage-related tail fiber protein
MSSVQISGSASGAGTLNIAAPTTATNRTLTLPDATGTLATTQLLPAGTIIYFGANTAPTGYLKANGAAVSRTTYADLFTAIGTTFGVGDGSTTFNVPDGRGEFFRGWDDGRGVDSGRVFGSTQSQDIQPHTHTVSLVNSASNGTLQPVRSAAPGNSTDNTGSTGTTETRPRNLALLACIKF